MLWTNNRDTTVVLQAPSLSAPAVPEVAAAQGPNPTPVVAAAASGAVLTPVAVPAMVASTYAPVTTTYGSDDPWTIVPQQPAAATPSIPGIVTPLGYWWSKLQPAAATYAPAVAAPVLTTPASGAVLTPAVQAPEGVVPAATPATVLPAITFQPVPVPATAAPVAVPAASSSAATGVPNRKILQVTTTSGTVVSPVVPASTLMPALSTYMTTPSTPHPFLSWLTKWFPKLAAASPYAVPATTPAPVIAVPITSGAVITETPALLPFTLTPSVPPPGTASLPTAVPESVPAGGNVFASPSPAAVPASGSTPASSPALTSSGTGAVVTRAVSAAPSDVLPRSIAGASPATCADALSIVLSSPGDFSILGEAIAAAGLTTELSSTTAVATVFAPTDTAFGTLLQDLDATADQLLANATLVAEILEYHVVPGEALSNLATVTAPLATLLPGHTLQVHTVGSAITVVPDGGPAATVVGNPVQACAMVIHIVDAVLIPAVLQETAS